VDASAKTKVNTKLRFQTKVNLNNPVFKPDLRIEIGVSS